MLIRNAIVADIPGLIRIETQCFIADECFVYSASHFKYIIQKAKADLLVAVSAANEVYGYVLTLYRSGSKAAHLYSIAVDPAQQKKGIGLQLFRAAETAALKKNYQFLALEVRAERGDLFRMYSSWGCEKIAILPNHYPDKMPAFRMRKNLGELCN